MIDFQKMDNEDFIFINKPLSDKEEKAFSDFLKDRKINSSQKNNLPKGQINHVCNDISKKYS